MKFLAILSTLALAGTSIAAPSANPNPIPEGHLEIVPSATPSVLPPTSLVKRSPVDVRVYIWTSNCQGDHAVGTNLVDWTCYRYPNGSGGYHRMYSIKATDAYSGYRIRMFRDSVDCGGTSNSYQLTGAEYCRASAEGRGFLSFRVETV